MATNTPKKKNKITIALAIVAVFVGICVALWVVLFPLLGSHWPQVPPPELFVTKHPKPEDISGNYQLIKQTITTNGLAFLEGRQCLLNLKSDGSFTVTNYPRWSQLSSAKAPRAEFISTTGHWHCETFGIYNGHQFFGIVFSDSAGEIDELALRSNGSPYDLMFTYGDCDDGTVMTFGKR
jgi:hypothetical protein